jgi:DNA modification methylase
VFEIYNSECLEHMKTMADNSIDCCITDPPYGMGMEHWDHSVPTADIWKEVLRILKPGGFCLSFCSPQLYHRMACAVEDAGFKIQDQIMWMITTKMPKKNRLKQAHEPIVVAQKPFTGSIKSNFEKWGVGQIDTANTRIPWDGKPPTGWVKGGHQRRTFGKDGKTTGTQKEFGKEDANPAGRYPSNIIGEVQENHQKYFYAPRVTRKERGEYNDHPTPKPISLMSYLIRVYCPEGKTVLDPFNGSGSTGIAAVLENRRYIGIEMSEHYCEVTKRRIADHTSEKE